MKKQIFEGLSSEEHMIVQLDLLKYENAFLRKTLDDLSKRITKLEETESEYLTKLELQQKHIDQLTAEAIDTENDLKS